MSIRPNVRRAFSGSGAVALAVLLAAPTALEAQFAPLGSLLGRVEDLSFYAGFGGLRPYSGALKEEGAGLRQFGVELLFTVSSAVRTCPKNEFGRCYRSFDPREVKGRDTIYTMVDRQISGPGGADTVYHYEVSYATSYSEHVEMQVDTIWDFEVGLGYGQLFGFEEAEGMFDLRGSVRELPAVTIYASHAHHKFYLGLKSGFMELNEVQAFEEQADGTVAVYKAKANSFLLGAALGRWMEVYDGVFFVEGSYSIRSFPSVNWGTTVPAQLPRKLSLSGWSVNGGLQFPIG